MQTTLLRWQSNTTSTNGYKARNHNKALPRSACLHKRALGLACITDKVHSHTNDVIINSLPIMLHINSNIDLSKDQLIEWVQKLLKIRITNCCTKVYRNNSQSKVILKYIEAYENIISQLTLRHPIKAIQEAKKCTAHFSLIGKWTNGQLTVELGIQNRCEIH